MVERSVGVDDDVIVDRPPGVHGGDMGLRPLGRPAVTAVQPMTTRSLAERPNTSGA
jgi:hypothetical protein